MIHLIIVMGVYVLGLMINLEVPLLIAAVAFFIGREHAQAEERIIKDLYNRKRANMPWWGGFDPRAWDIKSLLDFLLPIGFLIIVLRIL